MIDIPTTDILTPIKGEAGKATSKDHSDSAEVSFFSVVTAEDADTDALIAVPDQLISEAPRPNPKAENTGFAAAFPAFIVPTEISSAVTPQVDKLTDQFVSLSVVSMGEGDAQSVLNGDTRQISPATAFAISAGEPKVVEAPIAKPSDQIAYATGAKDLAPDEGNKAEQTLINVQPSIQRLTAAPSAENAVVTATPVKQNELGNTPAPLMQAVNRSQGLVPQPASDFSQANTASQDQTVVAQQPQESPQKQVGATDAKSVGHQNPIADFANDRATVLNATPAATPLSATRATQMPSLDQPMANSESELAMGDPKTLLKSEGTQSGPVRTTALLAQPQPEGPAKTQTPPKEVQPPTQRDQNPAKQSAQHIESTPTQPFQPSTAQSLTSGVTPQTILSPVAEKYITKRSGPQPVEQQTRTPSANTVTPASTETTPSAPSVEVALTETVEPISAPELLPFEVKSADTITTLRHDATLNRPEVMRHVAQQLTDAARQMPDRPVELALNPEELGRVRLTFTATDGGIHIAVMAERGETMDLMRRHIETLAQEFREMGYKDVNFEFSHDGQKAATDAESKDQNRADSDATTTQPQIAPVQLSLEPSAGLDLRL